MKAEYEICLFNPEKELVKELRGNINSLLKNYYSAFYAQLRGGNSDVKTTDGSLKTFDSTPYAWCNAGKINISHVFAVDAPEEDESYGILIGTSDAAVTPDDYNLGAQFSCWHSAVFLSDIYEEAGSLSLDITRTFVNDNIDTVIKEFGLVAKAYGVGSALVLRDVISPIDFPLDYSLFIRIKFSF